MSDSYTIKRGKFDSWEDIEPTKFIEPTILPTLFHVSEPGTNKPLITLKCTQCGGKSFNVAHESYTTAIRCIECKWEKIIHNG